MLRVVTINWSVSDGSIAKLIRDIEKEEETKCEFYHCYQVGEANHGREYLVAGWNVTRFYYALARIVGLKYGVGTIPTRKMIRYMKRISPDLVHIHCPNFYNINIYMLLSYLKKSEIPVVITNHAEFFYTGNCAYAEECTGYMTGCGECKRIFDTHHRYWINRTKTEWKKMKAAFENFKYLKMVVVSQWELERYKMSPIVKDIPVTVIENAVDTAIYHKKQKTEQALPSACRGRRLILNVTSRFSAAKEDLKGGYYLIQLAEKLPEYYFVVAGNLVKTEGMHLPDNLMALGNVTDKDTLADWYNLADLTVLTSKRETFGMSCAESLACGTPVVGFCAGGTESIALKEYTEFVEFGNVERLIDTVRKWIEKKDTFSNEMAQKAEQRYSIQRMGREYLQLYQELKAEK